MLKGNKGEWSEIYTFVKLLQEREIYAADEELNKNQAVTFPILKIIREEGVGVTEYVLKDGGRVEIASPVCGSVTVDASDLKSGVRKIFESIKGGEKTFSIPSVDGLLEELCVNTLNAGNEQKEDIGLEVHDKRLGQKHELGFSIKSKLGEPPTLLNASRATNFIFKVNGLSDSEISEVNAIEGASKIRGRVQKIAELGGGLEYHSLVSETFEKNLRKIDSLMPEILSEILLCYFSGKGTTFSELVKCMNESELRVLSFASEEDFIYKIKNLLNSVALGMVPSKLWDGNLKAHGGMIIVREDGEVVCYHLFNADDFRAFLFKNTRLESAGTTRHEYGELYKKEGNICFNLNLQIRFLK